MCSICTLRIEFSVAHPLTLSVSVATRRAIEDGILPPRASRSPKLTPVVAKAQRRQTGIAALLALQSRIEQVLSPDRLLALPDFFVLMTESSAWGYFHPTPDGFDTKCQRDPPESFSDSDSGRDPVVLISETAMSQIVVGKLPYATAAERGLVVVDAKPRWQEPIAVAFAAAYPTSGFSRFVCA